MFSFDMIKMVRRWGSLIEISQQDTLAQRKDAAVADLLSWRSDQIAWVVSFYRTLHARDQRLMTDFLPLIYSINARRGEEDNIC